MSRPAPGAELQRTGIVAILRGGAGAPVDEVVDVLVDAGVTCLEITMNTPGALDAVAAARSRHPGAEVGVGTARTPAQVQAAAAAGAQFVVSPDVRATVGAAAADAGLPWYPGALTATEVGTAWELGAAAVKLFPASLGGPGYLRELRAPLDDVPFVPTGGVRLEQVGDYLAAGAFALGIGSPLLGDALRGGSLPELAGRAERVLAAVRAGRA
jgi:2-dehydro-3-deoxyphosphogluconate aldolase/(4S)-4-hydroxy-2-oxoglutarate aldolase